MSLSPGSSIQHFDVVSLLGAGGMGEVYRARDRKLDRDVAIKVLPPLVAADADRIARFRREAQVLASLNHPNIAQIYGVEDAPASGGAVSALVMELVEGPTLAEKLATGPMPLEETTAIAVQIADALEAAHDSGIIHRDLKPANIKVRPDGRVKVLDFGLAKALDPIGSGASSATMSSYRPGGAATTEPGLILGTAAYMAPEQARGKPVDRRADIWAFGAVLYEMLTGKPPFAGETISDTLASVLTREPDWTHLPASTPEWIRTLLRRCLERDPRQRLQAIGEARIALSDPAALQTEGLPRANPVSARRTLPVAIVIGGLIAAAVLGFAARGLFRPSSPAAKVKKVDLAASGLQVVIETLPSISPDGQSVLYHAEGHWWVRTLDEFKPKALPPADGSRYAIWSHDSRDVAFVRDGKVWRMAVNGTEATVVGAVPPDLAGTAGVVWTAGGKIVLAGSNTVGLFSVSANGGTGEEIVPLAQPDEADFHDVTALPGDRGLLFTVHAGAGTDRIDAFAGGQRKVVLKIPGETLASVKYSPTGHLIFARASGVWAVRFSLDRLATEGEPFALVTRGKWPSVASDGTLAVVRPSDRPSELVSITRGGAVQVMGPLQGQFSEPGDYRGMAVSPDGRRVALTMIEGAGSELWSYEIGRGTMTRVSVGAQVVTNPTWALDGSRVFFAAFAGQRAWNILSAPVTEMRAPQPLMPRSGTPQFPCTISPDGKWIVYVQQIGSGLDLWKAPLDGSPGEPLTTTPFAERDAAFSPDGRWLAYTSDESGRNEVYVRAFPIDERRIQISTGGGTHPAWTPDGREVIYLAGTALASARVAVSGSTLQAAGATTLFTLSPESRIYSAFTVLPDGERFLFVRPTGDDRLSLVQGWDTR